MPTRLTFRRTTVSVAAALAALAVAPAAHASAPYADPHARGGMTFCDSKGRAITSGPYGSGPFAAKVVTDFVPPAPYDGPQGLAALYVYNPRPATDPGQWSGEILTASSHYTDRRHPSAEVIDGDVSMHDIRETFPPQVGDLLQMRMYYSYPGRPAFRTDYAAVDIHMRPGGWVLDDPAQLSCTSGTAVSRGRSLPTPPPASAPGSPGGAADPKSGGPSAHATAAGAGGDAAAGYAGSASAPGTSSSSSSAADGTSARLLGGLAAALLAAGSVVALRLRRRRRLNVR